MDATNIQQAKNNRFSAMRCTEKAMIYEDIRREWEEEYTKLYLARNSADLTGIKDKIDKYRELADGEWLATRNYEKGES